ncbi:HD domain-containing phosphohydrolase [Alkalicoccus urumqiensis]|uniref:HD domain-containing protein n=1 Tax=Alkalicoccus urumqiensis TaxID=1548213 RepID=A0A2P6MF07_ALKUR|nr:HD domain-containing phosphohydrolase [Alkalicoccus urumqiensis]PRO64830.1 hypothetical protein C6I21_13040 [Alkalicoccus urumqiensis]
MKQEMRSSASKYIISGFEFSRWKHFSGRKDTVMFHRFQKEILKSYLTGSLLAVFGVGGVLLFQTLRLNTYEIVVFLIIISISVVVMLLSEYALYRKHARPLIEVSAGNEEESVLQRAFIQAHRFPLLTVRRILGPHLFGLGIPASLLTWAAATNGFVQLEWIYFLYAWIGALLIAVMHAMVEFFLTAGPSRKFAEEIMRLYRDRFGKSLTLHRAFYVRFRTKLFISVFFTAVFPVSLLLMALEIRSLETGGEVDPASFWTWAVVILAVVIAVSLLGAYLLYKNIREPLEAIQQQFLLVSEGTFEQMDKSYSDEFDDLVHGFNNMVEGIQERDEKNDALLNSVFAIFAVTLDARDEYTAGHAERVADYAVKIAEKVGYTKTNKDIVRKAALLHDIGKIGIRDEVLLKRERLTNEEFQLMKEHPVIGEKMLLQAQLPEELKPVLAGVRHHHERFDGGGYPDGLSGRDIPELGRLLCVADSFDAMTSDRPYLKGRSREEALRIIEHGRGTQFDPVFADAFLELFVQEKREFDRTAGELYS